LRVFQVDPYSNQIVNMGAPLEPFSYDQRGNLTRQYLDPLLSKNAGPDSAAPLI